MSLTSKDYYQILGISPSASQEEIRRAFQKLARTTHPDICKEEGAEERFKEISEAYAVLSDDEKRRRYDLMRSGGYGGGMPQGTSDSYPQGDPFAGTPFEGFPFGVGFPFGGGSTWRTGASDFGSARRSRAWAPRVGSDVEVELEVSLDEVRAGTKRSVRYRRYEPCATCKGTGSVASAEPTACPMCGGVGHVTIDTGIFGQVRVTCPECEGTGRVVANPCPDCAGSGRVAGIHTAEVAIPARTVHDGSLIRLLGEGHAGTNGQTAGDLLCRISVPEAHLSHASATGFMALGLAFIFTVPNIVFWRTSLSLIVPVILLFVGLRSIARGGVGKNLAWWQAAAAACMQGVARGLGFALIIILVFLLTGGLFRF